MKSGRMAIVAIFCLLLALSTPTFAKDWYVSPSGSSGNAGTQASPWDLGSAVYNGNNGQVQPGDNILLLDGNYKGPWTHTFKGNPMVYASTGTGTSGAGN